MLQKLSNSTPTCKPNSASVWLEKKLTLFSHGRRRTRRRRKEGRNNPHLASSRKNDPTCLNFGDSHVRVYWVFGNCLEDIRKLS